MFPGSEAYSIPSNTPVVIVPTPAASTRRVVRWIKIYNPAGNGPIDLTLRFNNGTITSRLGKLTIADDDEMVISGREEDDAASIAGVDLIIHLALDDAAAKVVEAVAGSVPAAPLEVSSSWGDYV